MTSLDQILAVQKNPSLVQHSTAQHHDKSLCECQLAVDPLEHMRDDPHIR
jgi:hypothetical protein